MFLSGSFRLPYSWMTPNTVSALCNLHTSLLFSRLNYLFPFVLSWALPQAFGYYGNSVTLGLAAFRRSRICTQKTYSPFRSPRSFPYPCSLQDTHRREPS